MTINNNKQKFQDDLSISRNKAEFFIENYLNAVVDAFLGEEELVLPLNSARLGCLEYSKNAEKFEIYLELMVDIHQNLKNHTVRTKRDMYYGKCELYKKQAIIDAAVTKISESLRVPRDALNVIGAAKGIYFGKILINDQITAAEHTSLIPRREEISSIDLLDNRFVLVIEKDAVMSVIAANYEKLKTRLGPFLLISGKGFPCMRTKQFLNLIESECSETPIPILVLTDNDPYGIDIAINYASSTNKNEMDSCKSIQYIGVNHFDLDKYGNPAAIESMSQTELKRLEPLKARAKSLNRIQEYQEITFMQNNMKKAEIEALYYPDSMAFCTGFLVDKLVQGLSLMDEDAALKNRLLVDERVIRKVSKKLLSSSNNINFVDLQQLEFSFDKNLAIIGAFERDWQQISRLSSDIDESINKENESISSCKNSLLLARQELQNRLEYDQIAKEILAVRSCPELSRSIEDCNSEISDLVLQIEAIDNRTHERYMECSVILDSVQLLLDNVSADTKTFK